MVIPALLLLGSLAPPGRAAACDPCITVDPLVPGQQDELSGVYELVGEDPECPGGCSYSRGGVGPYCFGEGPRTGAPSCSSQSPATGETSPGATAGGSTTPGVSTGGGSTTGGATTHGGTTVAEGPSSQTSTAAAPGSTGPSESPAVTTIGGALTSGETATTGEATAGGATTGGTTALSPSATSTGGTTALSPSATSTGGATAVSPSATSTGGTTAVSPSATSTGGATAATTSVSGTSTVHQTTSAAGSTSAALATTVAETTTVAGETTTSTSCSPGWTGYGGQCYKLIQSETLTYTAAATACAAYGTGGLLAAPKTAEIQAVLTTLNSAGTPADFWIGLDDTATDETFAFSDGTTFTKTGGTYGGTDVTWSAPFTAWKTGQPAADTIASQDCVRTDTNGKWDDVGCSTKKFNYACQIPAGNPVSKVCGGSWTKEGSLCYQVVVAESGSEPDYATAATACQGLATGGKLAAPTSEAIMTVINTLNTVAGTQLWLGLDDRTTEGTYTFSDGSSFTKTSGEYEASPVYSATYTPWKAGQPKVAKAEEQDCVKFVSNTWDDVACTNTLAGYACQKPEA